MSVIDTLITDRMGGNYDLTDLNRVGEGVAYIADRLGTYGYPVTADPKTDWTKYDKPRAAQMTAYLADLNTLKDRFYGAGELPAAMDNIDYEDANDIERLLVEIETYINRMIAGFRKCGTFKCGQGVTLP